MAADAPRRGWSLGEAAASWASSRRVRSGRWWVRYREAGSGPPVVLVHGLGVSADYWYRNGPAIASSGYRCLAPDLPGFGRTDGPPRGLTIEEQAAALRDWSAAMELEPAVYVGHSLACQVVVKLAAEYPEHVRGLVLAGPTGDRRGPRMLRQFLGLIRDMPRESMRLVFEVGRAYLQAGPRRVLYTWRMGAREDVFSLLLSISAPGLVLTGSRDPIVHLDFAGGLAAALPGGELHVVEGAAHALIFTHPDAFNREVMRFAGRVSGHTEA